MVARQRSSFGDVSFVALMSFVDSNGKIRWRQPTDLTPGIWLPSERLAGLRRHHVNVPINRIINDDGRRRYISPGSLESLAWRVAPVGLEMLLETYGHNQHLEYSYRRMYYVWRYVRGLNFLGERGTSAHLTRSFNYSRDLFVRLSGRQGKDERNVLPESIGWSIKQLTERGRAAAVDAGHTNPTSELAIPLGFLEAARLNPLYLADHEVLPLVRMSLFALDDSAEEVSAALLDMVMERLLLAIHRHRDDSQEEFDRWFYNSSRNIVRQLADQKRAPGGRLRRENVVQALQQIGWESYRYVGDCLHTGMHCIRQAIPDDLSDEECRLYEHMYERQSYLGNLPLALVSERLNFLSPALEALWQNTNAENVAVMHRLLQYFSKMAEARRVADRISKSRRPSKSPRGDSDVQPAASSAEVNSPKFMDISLIENVHCGEIQRGNLNADVAEHFRELHNVECANGCTEWESTVASANERQITFEYHCGCKGQILTVPISEVRRIADEFREKEEEEEEQ